MPVWEAVGHSPDGNRVRDSLEAADRGEALRRFAASGIAVHRLREVGATSRRTAAFVLPVRDRARLYAELGALLEARVPLVDALETVGANAAEPRLARAAGLLRAAVAAGGRVSAAIGQAGAPEAETGAIAAGEAQGALGAGLLRLGHSLTRRAALRSALIGALIYPAILLAVTLLSLLAILLGVVPNLAPLFQSAGAAAPASARTLLAASELLQRHGDAVAGGLAVVALCSTLALRLPPVRQAGQRALLAVPLLGQLVQGGETAGLLRLFASLVAADTPVPDACLLVARATRLAPLRDAFEGVARDLRTGSDLARAVGAQRAIAPGATALIAVGAQTGRLAEMLDAAADALERETETRIARLMALLPPLMTVVLGGIVGGFAAVVMSAIMSANDLAL